MHMMSDQAPLVERLWRAAQPLLATAFVISSLKDRTAPFIVEHHHG